MLLNFVQIHTTTKENVKYLFLSKNKEKHNLPCYTGAFTINYSSTVFLQANPDIVEIFSCSYFPVQGDINILFIGPSIKYVRLNKPNIWPDLVRGLAKEWRHQSNGFTLLTRPPCLRPFSAYVRYGWLLLVANIGSYRMSHSMINIPWH